MSKYKYDRNAKIFEMKRAGTKNNDIAKYFGIHKSVVSNILRKPLKEKPSHKKVIMVDGEPKTLLTRY